ncbi:MAG: hypothetical protein WD887_02970, partial [Candidatus Saccharimonadales bacterium]
DAVSDNVDFRPWFTDAAMAATSSGNVTIGATGYESIQAAISVANPGDTINVAAGHYEEQVIINKSLTLTGAGRDNTFIESPAILASTGTGKNDIVAVVSPDSDNPSITVNISGITVDGKNQSIDNFVGVHFYGANGSLSNSRITGMRDVVLGSQSRWGVVVNHPWDTLIHETVSVTGNIVDNYQKSAIIATELGTSVTITGNTVTGAGLTTVIAQNGIEVNYGASGTVSNNTVSGHNYTPDTDYAAGILVVGNTLAPNPAQPATSISGNTVTENEIGVAISKDTAWGYGDGLATITTNSFSGNLTAVQNDNTTGTLDASNNWWGSANPDFSAIIFGNVNHDPWYTNAGMTTFSSAKAITAFSFPEGTGVINESNHTISVNVPFGTDVTALTSTISITTGAAINLHDAVQNFTSPVTYTVTAADASTQDYTVIVTILANTQTAPDAGGAATISNSTPQVVITNPTQAVDLTISSGTTNPTIDVSSFISGGTGTLPAITINSSVANVVIPNATVVTGPASWNGVIQAPVTGTPSGTAPAGFSVGGTVISVGSPDGTLT